MGEEKISIRLAGAGDLGAINDIYNECHSLNS
jgi:hypothetical protein